MKVLAEGAEPLAEPERGRDGIGADERTGCVALAREPGGQRRILRSEREYDIAADAVGGRILAGENRRVRRTGERHGRLRLIEAHTARGQRVDRGRGAGLRPVRTDVIGAQRVDGNEQQVGVRRVRRNPPPAGADCARASDQRDADFRRARHTGIVPTTDFRPEVAQAFRPAIAAL
jgi:hypothetical protein